MGNHILPKLIPRSAVRRCRKVQRLVRTDDRVAAEVKALAVELVKQHFDFPGGYVEAEQSPVMVADEEISVGKLLDAEGPAASVAEHDAAFCAHTHHIAIRQARYERPRSINQHILGTGARKHHHRYRQLDRRSTPCGGWVPAGQTLPWHGCAPSRN